VEFTPLVRNVSVEQTILNPSGCEVNFTSRSRAICGPLNPCHGVRPLVSCGLKIPLTTGLQEDLVEDAR
jgi:hypothetical protein